VVFQDACQRFALSLKEVFQVVQRTGREAVHRTAETPRPPSASRPPERAVFTAASRPATARVLPMTGA
jgi:hypothetical protein